MDFKKGLSFPVLRLLKDVMSKMSVERDICLCEQVTGSAVMTKPISLIGSCSAHMKQPQGTKY
jgi:hypothetical protein